MVKAIFFDRDGVINKMIDRDGMRGPPWTLEEFEYLPGVKKSIDIAKELGYNTFIVTNQPDVLDFKMKFDELSKIMIKIRKDLKIDDYICACRRGSNLYKPSPGMINHLVGYYGIEPRRSYMIGDTWKDIESGRAAGVKTIYIGGEPLDKEPDYYAANILHACEIIKELENEAVR